MNEMKMVMCMSTAHDVRTPLASLGIVISSLRSNVSVDETCSKLLDEAIVNVEVLNLVATQFMEIGMMGSGVKIKATIDVLNVVTMLKRIENVRRPPWTLFPAHRSVLRSIAANVIRHISSVKWFVGRVRVFLRGRHTTFAAWSNPKIKGGPERLDRWLVPPHVSSWKRSGETSKLVVRSCGSTYDVGHPLRLKIEGTHLAPDWWGPASPSC